TPSFDGDWIATTERELPIAIAVADCTAILLHGVMSSGQAFVSAVHAGWRGTAAGIIQNVVREIEPQELKAWLSPSICQNHFEVGDDVKKALDPASHSFFR